MKRGILLACFTGLICTVQAQQNEFCSTSILGGQDCKTINPITTAVPFLAIGPDSRSGAMGEVGAALSPDANAQFWNASRLAFAEKETEISLSYSPWLRELVNDMNLAYLSGYRKLNDRSAIGGSLRYFNLGSITFTNDQGQEIRDFNPNEFAFDLSYSLLLSQRWSGGITARYINSNLTGGTNVGGSDSKAGNAFAVDISTNYRNPDFQVGDKDATIAFGAVISNIGNKISYTDNVDQDFLPTNMRLGGALTVDLDEFNKLTFAYDATKLLVPTPPVYDRPDLEGYTGEDDFIIAGEDDEVSVVQGIFQSFGDAPGRIVTDEDGSVIRNPDGTVQVEDGSVLREELREIMHSVGLEYTYADQFAIRGGYFHEDPTKGNRRYFTVGLGVKYQVFGLDLSYLIPAQQQHPLAKTIRFTLRLQFSDQQSSAAEENAGS